MSLYQEVFIIRKMFEHYTVENVRKFKNKIYVTNVT